MRSAGLGIPSLPRRLDLPERQLDVALGRSRHHRQTLADLELDVTVRQVGHLDADRVIQPEAAPQDARALLAIRGVARELHVRVDPEVTEAGIVHDVPDGENVPSPAGATPSHGHEPAAAR